MKESFGGLAGWVIARLCRGRRAEPRLAVLERIALAPRHSLALVEAEGRRILVATSAEGGPAFFPLDGKPCVDGAARSSTRGAVHLGAHGQPRVSW